MLVRKFLRKLQRGFRKIISPVRFHKDIYVGEESSLRRQGGAVAIESSWDDLLDGVETVNDWKRKKEVLRQRYLALIRDDQKPAKVPLDLKIHKSVVVDGLYQRQTISYNVEEGERAHAYLGMPLGRNGALPGIVALHGTFEQGKEQTAGLAGSADKAYLDHLARRGYVVIVPDHFVVGDRGVPGSPYDTKRFYQKHPNWTAVGKFTFENSIAIDVLQTLDEVNADRIGVLGHSLGGHSSYFLAAYDSRIKAAACNCGAGPFRHNPQVGEWARDHWYIYFKHLRPLLQSGYLPPIDMHEIIALIAPRAFLDLSSINDGNSQTPTQRQRILMNSKIMEVYELEKASANFSFYVHGQGHCVPHDARTLMYAWMDKHLKPPGATQTHLITTA